MPSTRHRLDWKFSPSLPSIQPNIAAFLLIGKALVSATEHIKCAAEFPVSNAIPQHIRLSDKLSSWSNPADMSAPPTANAETVELARRVRLHTVRMTAHANASHVGSGLSMADILAVLYGSVLKIDPNHPGAVNRDRMVLGKGHGAAALYAVLAERGFFPLEWLERFCDEGQPLAGHVAHRNVPGVEVSTGALGHGLSIALGMAFAARSNSAGCQTYALLSDGELNEGATWEAVMSAGHHGMENLTAVIDYNGIQSFGRTADVLDLEPLADKWRAFGWNVVEIDGHDHAALYYAFAAPRDNRPKVLIARTVKGNGVSFMENTLEWHYRSLKGELLDQALAELGGRR